MVEPECCVHEAILVRGGDHRCPDCGLSGYLQRRERELREQGWSVNEIAELGLLDG